MILKIKTQHVSQPNPDLSGCQKSSNTKMATAASLFIPGNHPWLLRPHNQATQVYAVLELWVPVLVNRGMIFFYCEADHSLIEGGSILPKDIPCLPSWAGQPASLILCCFKADTKMRKPIGILLVLLRERKHILSSPKETPSIGLATNRIKWQTVWALDVIGLVCCWLTLIQPITAPRRVSLLHWD